MYTIELEGEVRGTTAYAEDAAMFASLLGDGAKVLNGEYVVWIEGELASQSYKDTADMIRAREDMWEI